MTTTTRQLGFAPAVSIVEALVYVAYGVKPDALILDVFTPACELVKSVALDGGFFDSFPVFSGRWLAYKRNTDWRTAVLNVVDGQTFAFGEADGNWPIALNDALGLVAWQTGRTYDISFGSLIDGSVQPTGQLGAPDGLSALTGSRLVTLRKDVRPSIAGIFYPVRSGDLVVGEWISAPYGIGARLDGDALRVAFAGQDCPTPSCAADGQIYALVTGGPQGVRLWVGSRADVQALPRAADVTVPIPSINRALALGWFHFGGDPETAPGNCTLQVDSDMLVRERSTGKPMASYVAGDPDGDVDALDRAIAAGARLRPTLPVLAYWTAAAQKVRVPVGAQLVGVEAYCHVTESLEAFEARVMAAVSVCPAAVLIAQCYASNAGNTPDVGSLVPVFARIAKDWPNVWGVLAFSSGARATGWDDQPDAVHDAWKALFASVSGLPAFPQPHIAPPPFKPPTPPVPPKPPVPPVAPAPVLNGKDIMLIDPSKAFVYAKSVNKHASRAGLYTITLPNGRIFSCQPDGSAGDRDPGADGGYEACTITGTLATFQPVPGKFYTFGVVPVDGL